MSKIQLESPFFIKNFTFSSTTTRHSAPITAIFGQAGFYPWKGCNFKQRVSGKPIKPAANNPGLKHTLENIETIMRKRPKHADEEAEVDMTPMLDIVFIMLIFFIVTTSFTKESGVDLSRPAPVPPDQQKPEHPTIPIMFVIDQNDIVTMEGREIDFRAVGANVEREKAKHPKSAVIVNVHPDASNEAMIKVVDAARAAGVDQVNVATTAVTKR